MSVPTHGRGCITTTHPMRCDGCGSGIFYFSCTCGSKVFFEPLDPFEEHFCPKAKASRLGKISLKLESQDPRVLDKAIGMIVQAVSQTGSNLSGPIPLPTTGHKGRKLDDRGIHFIHRRLIRLKNPSKETMDFLESLDIPEGVYIEIKSH